MAQTPDEMRAEIAYTREQLGQTLDELNRAVARTKRRIPFYGIERRQILTIAAWSRAGLSDCICGSLRQAEAVLRLTRAVRQLRGQERGRQQLVQGEDAPDAGSVGQDNRHLWAKLGQHLPAGATWADSIAGNHCDRVESARTRGHRLEHGVALGADRQPVGRIFDVAAGE